MGSSPIASTILFEKLVCYIWGRGGTGRRTRLRIWRVTVGVQVPSTPPLKIKSLDLSRLFLYNQQIKIEKSSDIKMKKLLKGLMVIALLFTSVFLIARCEKDDMKVFNLFFIL